MQVSLQNVLNVLFVCCFINLYLILVYSIVMVSSNYQVQNFHLVWPDFSKNFLKRFLLRLNAIISVALNTPQNSVFICKIFQFSFTILNILGSVLLYVIDSGILFLLFSSLHVNSSFLSVLLTFLICSSRTSSLYCQSRNFCLMIAQFLSNSVLVEQIVFSLKA